MKKILFSTLLLLMSLVMVSCSSQDNNGNIKETDSFEKTRISQLYDGYEELQGKKYSGFTLPQIIEKPTFDSLYRFPDRRGGSEIPSEEENTIKLFKRCFGDKYDNNALDVNENWDKSKTYSLFLPDGTGAVVLHGFPVSIIKDPSGNLLTSNFELLNTYTGSERDKTVELRDGRCTTGELLDGIGKCLERDILPSIGGFDIYPLSIHNCKNSDGICYAEIEYGIKYKGIPLEDKSAMFISQQRSGYQVITSYSISTLSVVTAYRTDYSVFSSTFSDQYPLVEELSEAISLDSAVQLLQKELAPNINLEFDSVELKYCCKITAPTLTVTDKDKDSQILADYGEIKTAFFEPTWCFYYRKSYDGNSIQEAVKVNAITGEITIDK